MPQMDKGQEFFDKKFTDDRFAKTKILYGIEQVSAHSIQ